jgi:hypothetical protein
MPLWKEMGLFMDAWLACASSVDIEYGNITTEEEQSGEPQGIEWM